MQFLKSIFRPQEEILAENFISTKSDEFERWQDREAEKADAWRQFNLLKSRAEESEAAHSALLQQLDFLKNADIAFSIYKRLGKDISTIMNILPLAEKFCGSHILKIYGDEIVKLSAKEMAEAAAKFEAFQKENRLILETIKRDQEKAVEDRRAAEELAAREYQARLAPENPD